MDPFFEKMEKAIDTDDDDYASDISTSDNLSIPVNDIETEPEGLQLVVGVMGAKVQKHRPIKCFSFRETHGPIRTVKNQFELS